MGWEVGVGGRSSAGEKRTREGNGGLRLRGGVGIIGKISRAGGR